MSADTAKLIAQARERVKTLWSQELRDDEPTTLFFLQKAYDRERAENRRLREEVSRRDVVLDWIEQNAPATLELCPYKITRAALAAGSDDE